MVKLGRKFALQLQETGIELDDDWTSDPISLGAGFNVAVQVFLFNDSDAYGSMEFQVTNDRSGTWHPLPFGTDSDTSIEVSGDNVDNLYDLGCIGAGWFRVKYTRTSGSGVLDLHCIRKRIHS